MHDLDPYTAQDARTDTVGPYSELWRTMLGLVLVMLVSFVVSFFISGAFVAVNPEGLLAGGGLGSTAPALLLLLSSFLSVAVGVHVAAKTLQRRSLRDVVGPGSVALMQFWGVLKYLFLLMLALVILPPYGMDQPLQENLSPARWIALLPLAIGALLIQTGSEEILFRGYLQQSLAARFRSPALFIGVPSVLFALGHYMPAQAGDNAWLVVLWAGVFGILMADLTARAGTLGPAVAIHFFNNFTAIALIAPASSMNGLALYTLPFDLSDSEASLPWMAVDFAMLIVCWLIGRLAIRR